MNQYYLFGTAGCHLCEEAEQLVNKSIGPICQTREIAENSEWIAQYALRIPVLHHVASKRELNWPFNQQLLQEFIDELR